MYADDIIIISPSLFKLQSIYSFCENFLLNLDMSINSKKSFCLRIGPRYNVHCINVVSSTGCVVAWSDEIRYLGVHILSYSKFRVSLTESKCSFNRALNAIFGKVGRFASEQVTRQLVNSKCLPVLLYATEACNLTKHDIYSLDFIYNRFLMKLLKTNNMDIIKDCTLFSEYLCPALPLNLE